MKPLAIDLYAGLGGWTDGLLAEGWDVIGFDIEQHRYGDARYPAQLIIQDVLTLHGSQFRDADLIVASPPCQAYSYRAMPWSRAKALPPPDNDLFDACFRIQREACEAAGRHIPLIVENVRGAQKWVGRSRWNYGSYHLWGDVPALMPMTQKVHFKIDSPHLWLRDPARAGGKYAPNYTREDIKNNGGSWFAIANGRNPDGRKAPAGTQWFNDGPRTPESLASSGSKSNARKAASAMIAKIPFHLAKYIAYTFHPRNDPTRRVVDESDSNRDRPEIRALERAA